ncbi:MAG TPA: single-stranded DNA-binding protein [Aeromicrobium sp.]|nr:single-stranded DNA-binding protein [Aeromicrobium sp.]HKY57615.1 single-stranded DNA-binding protein [Aeromicrobium sp.]
MLPNITIEGRAVNDPELRFTPSGQAVANFRVACSESKKRDDGTWEDGEKLFTNVAIWGKDAEAVAERVTKGAKVTVTGRLYQREYETSAGEKRTSLELKFATVALPVEAGKQQVSQTAADPWATTPAADDAPPF